MSGKRPSKSLSLWLQVLSLTALALIPLVVFRAMMNPPDLISQPRFVGLIFIIICLLGAIVGVRPSIFSRSVPRKSRQKEYDDSQEIDVLQRKPTLRGHHYSCDSFSDHVLLLGKRIYCAGCTGLTAGAVFAIIGSYLYFFLEIPLFNALLVLWTGFLGVSIGLVQHQIYRILGISNGYFRFALNVFFVFGAFLIFVGANQLTGNLAVDIYLLCIILLWIFTRIMMSGGEHERICMQCDDESCSHPLC